MIMEDAASLVKVISEVSRTNRVNYALLDATSDRADAPFKRSMLNITLFVLLILANLLRRSDNMPARGGKVQLIWSRHRIPEFPSVRVLSWQYRQLRLPVRLTLGECWMAFRLGRRAARVLAGAGRDTLLIALEVMVWRKIIALYRPSHILHNGTICRRSYSLSAMASPEIRIYALQHGYLIYPTKIVAPTITGFIRDPKFPEQEYAEFLRFRGPNRVRSCDFSKARWQMAPNEGASMALALNPNVTFANLRLIRAASKNSARFARIYLYLHPRQSRTFYRLVSCIFPKCVVSDYRHRNLDTLVTFPSSIILEFQNSCAQIYMVTYLAQTKANPAFFATATTLAKAHDLEKALSC